jgi:uncharacterized protein YndB with AHSA1/START domain
MNLPSELAFAIRREVLIRAPRPDVFRYFTDSGRFARWWGEGSTIDPRAGGAVRIVYPGGVVALGEVLEIAPPERIVFTFGFEAGAPIAPGGSRVTVTVEEEARGARVRLLHEVTDSATGEAFVQGWRYQLAVFANVVADEVHAGVAATIDRWFAAWNESDARTRLAELRSIASPGLTFSDAFSCTVGVEDLNAHVSAAKVHLPGLTIARDGSPLQCQGSAIARWTMTGPDGGPAGAGANLFELGPDGRIGRVVGFRG